MQDLALGLVGLHKPHTAPSLQPAQVPLDSIPFLQGVNCTTQPGTIHEVAEDALNPTAHVIGKDVKQ